MNRQIVFAALLLATLPMTGVAAGKTATASMQVSFTVVESCSVQTGSDRPTVQCQLDTPYLMQVSVAPKTSASAASAPASTSAKSAAEPTVVYF